MRVTLHLEAHQHGDEVIRRNVDAVTLHALKEEGLAHRLPGCAEVPPDGGLDLVASFGSHDPIVPPPVRPRAGRMLG
jgi:hypothetical protein